MNPVHLGIATWHRKTLTEYCVHCSYCTCSRCQELLPAAQDTQYASILDAVGTANPSSRRLQELVEVRGSSIFLVYISRLWRAACL